MADKIIVKVFNGSDGKIDREIKEVSYWQDNVLKTVPATADSIEAYLLTDPVGSNIITADGRLYASESTPGYCDGELTCSRNELLRQLK